MSASRLAVTLSVVSGTLIGACFWPSIMPKARHTLECEEDDIETNHAGPIRIVTGCGKKDVIIHDPVKDDWVSLRERAAFDLTCGNTALDVTELDATTFGVSGCGQKATYKYVPTSGFVRDAKEHLEPSEQDPNGTEKGPPIDKGGTKEQPTPGSSASAVPSLREPTPPPPPEPPKPSTSTPSPE
ncbi:MAG: hypothetical protein U0414_27355 [Polyangiaceae bacterium]